MGPFMEWAVLARRAALLMAWDEIWGKKSIHQPTHLFCFSLSLFYWAKIFWVSTGFWVSHWLSHAYYPTEIRPPSSPSQGYLWDPRLWFVLWPWLERLSRWKDSRKNCGGWVETAQTGTEDKEKLLCLSQLGDDAGLDDHTAIVTGFMWGQRMAEDPDDRAELFVCPKGCEKGHTHCSLHGNTDWWKLWNPEWVTSWGWKAPTPVLLGGSAKTLETDLGPSLTVTQRRFLFWPSVPRGPWSYSLIVSASKGLESQPSPELSHYNGRDITRDCWEKQERATAVPSLQLAAKLRANRTTFINSLYQLCHLRTKDHGPLLLK